MKFICSVFWGCLKAYLCLSALCSCQDLEPVENKDLELNTLRWDEPLLGRDDANSRDFQQRESELIFMDAPDQGAIPKVISGFEDDEKLSKMISLKVERQWVEGNKIKMLVSLKNDTNKGTRATFYRFGHDELGRVVSADRREIFFKPYESIFQKYEFSKTGVEAHWSFSVK